MSESWLGKLSNSVKVNKRLEHIYFPNDGSVTEKQEPSPKVFYTNIFCMKHIDYLGGNLQIRNNIQLPGK